MNPYRAIALTAALLAATSADAQDWQRNPEVATGGGYEIIAASSPGTFEYRYSCSDGTTGTGRFTVDSNLQVNQTGGGIRILNAQVRGSGFKVFGVSASGTCDVQARSQPMPSGLRMRLATVHIDRVQNAQGPLQVIADCANNTVCNQALQAAAAYVGVPPDAIRAVQVADLVIGRAGEDTDIDFQSPPGMSVCKLRVAPISIVPASGDRGSIFAIRIQPDRVNVHTWTPTQQFGQGRAWWEGDLFITYVDSSQLDRARNAGVCTIPDGAIGGNCRGTSGGNGFPACGNMSF